MTHKEDLIKIGRITKSQGLKGEVRIAPMTDFPQRFEALSSVFLTQGEEIRELSIENVRYSNRHIILKFKDIESRTDAETLTGFSLKIEEANMVELPEDTYFVHDLIGMQVWSDQDEKIGDIKDVYNLPANDVYVVEDDTSGKEHLIPAVGSVIKDIDVANRRMVIHVMEGLL